jgi:hypothetical protein
MSLIFKKAARENLSNVSVYVDDTSNTSPKYFRVSDVPQVLQKGKNLLRISAHPTNLVEGSQILVDVRDSNGNPIYFEIPDYLEADKSRVISIWIYNDKGDDNTANGDAVITLVGISKVGNNGEPIPERFRGKPNVRWQTTVNVDRDRKNTSSVIFKSNTLPSVAISESIEAYQNQPQSGNELLLQSQTGTGARYLFKGTTPIVQLNDGTQFNQEMVGYSFVLSNYESPAEPISNYPNPNSDTFYSSSISQVLDATTAVLRTPYTTSFADRDELVHTYNNIESANYSIQYFQTGSNIVTENQRSFANLTLTNVNPIAGVVDKVKVLIKSDGLPGEYELLNEVTVPYSSSFSVKVPIPSENLQDPKLLKIQYLNSIGEISRTETITSPFVFQGGNFYFGGGDNLITGSIYISNAIGSGIEVGGASSGFMRSVGFEGQTSASLGKGPGGFIIYSGSNALKIGEDYLQGVGMQMIGDNDDRHFIFTTHDGGLLDVKTDKFFIGTTDSQFISGSDSNIEISSSLFHLDPKNELLIIGADAVINSDLTVNNIRTPAIINGSPSTRTNSSSSIDSDGFARFVSASIGGFEVSETQINSANDNIILKASGQITASDGFLFGNKGTSQYVQFDDGNLVVRGDLSVDQIFTPATINGSPANINNASSSITQDGFAKFVSASIAGFTVNTEEIKSSDESLRLKSDGQLTGSAILLGDKPGGNFVQFDGSSMIVRGDLSVDQIFTPATIGGSPANLSNASSSITSEGFAKFVSASIGGWDITTNSIEGGNLIMKPEGILQTRDFASGLKGWKISSEGNGTAEFENVRIRGTMRTTTFEKESVNAVGGQLWVANSTTITGSVVAADTTMSVKNVKGFEEGEIVLIKKVDNSGFQTEYVYINSSSIEGDQSNEDENYGKLYVTRAYGSGSQGDYVGDLASVSQSYEDGQVVVSTGKINTGYIKLNANPSDTATPYIDIVERTGSDLFDVKLAARLGDLSGLANSSYVFGNSNPGFGLATDNVYLQGGIIANTGSIGGINMEAGKLYNGNGTWANSNTGFYIDSASNFSLGNRLTWNGSSLVVRGQIQLADGTAVEEAINAVTESSTARALSIGVDSQVYAFDNSADTTATPDTIVFTISQQNLIGTITTSDVTITKSGGSTITTPTLSGVVTDGSGQLSGSLSFSGESLSKSDLPLTIEVSKDSLLDTTTIFKVEGGADGAAGSDGAAGADGVDGTDALTAFLTNESHTFPSDVDGNISSFSGGETDMIVFQGVTDVTTDYSFSRASTTSVSSSISDNTVTITSMAHDSGSVIITATSASVTLNKTMSLAKSKQGSDGLDGAAGANAKTLVASVDSQVFAFDDSSDTTATPTEVIFSFNQQNLSGTIGSGDITITTAQSTNVTGFSLDTSGVTDGSGIVSGSLTFSGALSSGGLNSTKANLPVTISVSKDSLSDSVKVFRVEGGTDGADGADGVSTTGFRIEYSTSTTEADPGSGKFRFNATDPASATEVYISETDLDGLGVAPLLNQLTSSTNTPNKSIITFRQEANQAYYDSAYVTDQTDNGGWRTVDITHIDKNGWSNLSNGDSTFMAIAVLGDSGEAGADGADGVTTFLTNEAHTFAAATDGTIVSFVGGSTDMEVFEGVTNVTSNYTISASNGVGVSSSLAPPKTVNIGALANDSGSVIITATSASVSLSKTMSLVKSKQGVAGADGTSAKLLIGSLDSQVFAFDDTADTSADPTSIIFSFQQQNLSGTISSSDITISTAGGNVTNFDFDNNDVSSGTGIVSGSISFSGALNTGGLNSTKSNLPVTITATKDGLEDSVKIFKVEGGANGENGADGTDGVSAITAFLTNDSHTLPISSSDEVISFTGASTDIIVFQGTSDVTDDYTISRTAPAHMTTTLVGDTVTLTNSTTPFTGSIVITATSESVSLAKTMSISEARQGETGAQGEAGADNQDFTWANENLTGVGPIASPGLLMTSNVFGFHDGIAGSNGSLDDFTSYLDSDGNFYLGSGSSEAQFVWDNTTKELLVSGSNANITVDRFFLGGASQFVSGSNGNLEISSSNFHLQPGGDAILNGTIYADAGRIASFIISSSNFDAFRLVQEFEPIPELSGSINVSTPELPDDIDTRATITISGVTSSRIPITNVSFGSKSTTITLDRYVFAESGSFEIFYTESIDNFTGIQSGQKTVAAKFQSSSFEEYFPTASIASYSASIMDNRFTTYSTMYSDSYFLNSVVGVQAIAFDWFTGPGSYSKLNNSGAFFIISRFSDDGTGVVTQDERTDYWPNGDDLEMYVDVDINSLNELTGSTTTPVSSSDVKTALAEWNITGSGQFTVVSNYEEYVANDGFETLINSSDPVNDFVNTYWTASYSGGGTYYLWVSSATRDDGEYADGNGQRAITYSMTASYTVSTDLNAAPDSSLTVRNSVSNGLISTAEYNTLTQSPFIYIQSIAEQGGVQAADWHNDFLGDRYDSIEKITTPSASVLGVTNEQINFTGGPVANQNYNAGFVYGLLLQPGWFINPDALDIINSLDNTTGSMNGWYEIQTTGSVSDYNPYTSVGNKFGFPLKLRQNDITTVVTSSSELKLINGIWPLDIAESGSIPDAGQALNNDIIALAREGGINITSRLDATRVQTDLTPAELAIIYPDDNEFSATPDKKFSINYESTNTYTGTGFHIDMGYQSGSFIEKTTFSISGSGEISSSKFFVDERGNITGSNVFFTGGTISGSQLNLVANQFDFGDDGAYISGSNGSLIISSSLFSLTDNSLEVKGDLRASSGYIQDTYLGGKIVELGVQNPNVSSIRYQLPFIEVYSTSSTDTRLTYLTGSARTNFQGSHGKWTLSAAFQNTPQMLVTGSALDGVGYPDEFKSWYDISGVGKDYKFISDFNTEITADASSSLDRSLIGNQLVFNKQNTFRTGSTIYNTITSENIYISESFASSNYKNAHLQFAVRGTTHPYSGGFKGFFPQYKVEIVSGSTTFYEKIYKDENATHENWVVFDIPISDILTNEATSNTDKIVEELFKVRLGMYYSGSSATGTVGSGVEGMGWSLTEMRVVEPARVAAIDTQTIYFKDTYLTWDGKEVTAHKGHFAPIITSSLFESVSGSRYTLGRPKQRWQTAYLKNSVDTLSDRNLKKNIEISPLGLGFIESLKPVKYDFKDDNTTHYGLIAQEVSQSLAEFDVHIDDFGGYNGNEGYLSLKYEEFISPMIKAIQDQQQIIKDLQSRIETLESGSTN